MYKICVFAGTTEGRQAVAWLCTQPVEVTACVATEYGGALLSPSPRLTISSRPLPPAELTELLRRESFSLVIDATHPYAVSITQHLSAACRDTGTRYLRLLRQDSALPADGISVPNADKAVELLRATQGNILLTTGSKALDAFSKLPQFRQRAYARVLPTPSALEACQAAGLDPSHIIAMQGPFSLELDLATLRFASASWLVTKDGGDPGGFMAKVQAAAQAGARLVVIGRPPQTEGVSFPQMVQLLCRQFGLVHRPHVFVVGAGPGGPAAMTQEVREAIWQADCLIGARRLLDAARPGQAVYEATSPQDIAGFISAHPEHSRFTVAMSGDTGFYSGTKKLLPLLSHCQVQVLPGVSSLAYLCARLHTSYEDVFITSVHGRQHDIVPDVRAHRRVFLLAGGARSIGQLCADLVQAGLGHVQVSIGQQLSYPDEQLIQGTASQLAWGSCHPLSVALIQNPAPDRVTTHGLPDHLFQRGDGPKGTVPMTKQEVRSICLSKLQLTRRAVCWDIGAGTGSVAVEMALQAQEGQVYAVERHPQAAELLARNRAAARAENLSITVGCAPDACRDLPPPSHVFIGGSAGRMREILALVLERSPGARIVATAVSLESVAELTACLDQFPFVHTEVVSVQISRSRQAGAYRLMIGQDPIYIFTMQTLPQAPLW